MQKYLIVVDMQKDFVDGALGTKEAVAIVPNVVEKVKHFDGQIVFTMDTHPAQYLSTQEGHYLPVEHCIENTEGWQIIPELREYTTKDNAWTIKKPTFGSANLAEILTKDQDNISEIELIGLCTDICVVSNALLLKAFMPEKKISVDPACCAGVTPEKHQAALETMRSCQIQIEE